MSQEYIGRFEVIAELGRGGMATVFHAYDPDFDRPVAVKVMPREFLHVPDFRTRFQREARIIANLEHDAIVPVYELGEDDDLPYLVMRYMPGGSLADQIAREPLAVQEVMRLFERIAPAIDKAHMQGFVHRDLKPDNILFDGDDKAFIADFGIAKLMHSTSQLTGSGALIGTPAYMSPEQIQDKGEVDHRSDLYALGVILYECLTGEMPFKVDSSVGYFSAHLNDPVPDIRAVRPYLPPAFSSIIYRAMAKDKDQRYQSAAEIAADVAHALDSDAYLPEAVETSSPTRRLPYALIGGAALVLVLAALWLTGVLGGGTRRDPIVVRVTATSNSASAEPPDDTLALTASDASGESIDLRTAGWIVYSYATGLDPEENYPNYDIYKMRADGQDRTRLTITDASDDNPAWSPDGTQIAFNSDRDGNKEIYVMDADGLNQTRLTYSEGSDFGPRWSPDGMQIVFASERDGNREIYVMDADGSNQTRLTDNDARDYWPDWSPDGSRIVFSSSRIDGVEGIFIMNTDGTGLYEFLPADNLARLYPRWSPDGLQIAIYSDFTNWADPDAGCPTEKDTILVNLDGSNRGANKLITTGKCLVWVTWSPDGQYVVGLSNKTWGQTPEIFNIEIHAHPDSRLGDDSLLAQLTDVSFQEQFFWPDWWAPPANTEEPEAAAESIDLRTAGWIVYSYADDLTADDDYRNTNLDIYSMRADGEEHKRLTVTDARDENPAWSPDGTQIAFNSDRDGNNEIYIMDEDGLNQTRLTFSEGSDFGPRWSPDGSQIVFASERDGNREIYVMDADGSNQTRLTTNNARDYWPDWSPDGTRIAFASSRIGGVEGIFVMNADGSDVSIVVQPSDNFGRLYPRWSPDGTQIAFRHEKPRENYCGLDTSLVDVGSSTRRDPVMAVECMEWGSWSPDGRLILGFFHQWLVCDSCVGRWELKIYAPSGAGGDPGSLITELNNPVVEEVYTSADWKP